MYNVRRKRREGASDYHGLLVKGPAHIKTESSRVPFLTFQIINRMDYPLVKKCYAKRAIFQMPDGNIMVVTKSATWPLRSRLNHSLTRIYPQVAGILTEHYIRKYSNTPGVGMVEALDNDNELLRLIGRKCLALLFLGNSLNNNRVEGFPGNMRRLIHQMSILSRGRQVARFDGARTEEKVQECITHDVYCLLVAHIYNEELIPYMESRGTFAETPSYQERHVEALEGLKTLVEYMPEVPPKGNEAGWLLNMFDV